MIKPSAQNEWEFVGALMLFRALVRLELSVPTPSRIERTLVEIRKAMILRGGQFPNFLPVNRE